jgi:sulfur-oxidizing protein SoxZ
MKRPLRTMVTVPAKATRGQLITVRALAQHPMENGFRHNENGQRIERDILTDFICLYNGIEVFRAKLHTGIAANPVIEFNTLAIESGELIFEWRDGDGLSTIATARIEVA